jgi:hypothetical protein
MEQKYLTFWAAFYHGQVNAFILKKMVLGDILGDFFPKLVWSP